MVVAPDALTAPEWPRPAAAYVHVPFCRHRCGYCNFSVLVGRDADYADAFLAALERELEPFAAHPVPLRSLFIGGGTPTHLPAPWLEKLLTLLARTLPLQPDAEYSVEANPGDINPQRLEVLAKAGVNRISMGVQSFHADTLQHLERDHSPESATRAVEQAAAVIGNVSIDLIFGAPHQSLEQWSADLDNAAALPLRHISTYGLTYEKGTRFWARRQRGDLSALPEDTELAMYQLARQRLKLAAFEHYEVSNFARENAICAHNCAYWEGRGWYAFGPGAARFVNGRREVNHRSPTTYIRRMLAGQSATAESETLDRETWARERLVFGLRMLRGVDLNALHSETGVDLFAACGPVIDHLIADGWLERADQRVRITERGLPISDSIVAQLF